MTPGAVTESPKAWVPGFRRVLSVAGVALVVLALVPPVWGWSLKYGFVQSLQFCIFAFAAPAVVVAGAPWRRLTGRAGWVARWNARRVRDRAQLRTLWAGASVIGTTIFWRIAPVVNATVRHSWLVPVEALTLFVPSVLVMMELVESPPFAPGISRPYRIGVTAVMMWSVWIVAYLAGMSHASWYTAFHHVAGAGVSAVADQQLSTGVVWFVSAAVYVPIVFWNLMHWLQSDEDPNEEMIVLFRQEREHGFFGSAD